MRTAMIAITTSNSINVKPPGRVRLVSMITPKTKRSSKPPGRDSEPGTITFPRRGPVEIATTGGVSSGEPYRDDPRQKSRGSMGDHHLVHKLSDSLCGVEGN